MHIKIQTLRLIHSFFAILLAVFFIYSGLQKFIPKPPRPENTEEMIKAINDNSYTPPVTFKFTMKSFKASGFLKIVGIIQILSGLLMIHPNSRLLGLLLLLPIVINIFLLHLTMDNRLIENIETGFYLTLTCVLILFYYKKLLGLWGRTTN
jgi:uncharacterized membrane protein YphA (DoxX/SURF4 family)